MRELFTAFHNCQKLGENTILVSILADSGSAPRGLGAHMLVGEKGRICGTIGGGAVEHDAERLAMEALTEGRSFDKQYHLSRDLGMICGGAVLVAYRFLPANDAKLRELTLRALKMFEGGEEIWLIINPEGLGLADSFEQSGEHRYAQLINSAERVLIFGGGHVAQALVPVLAKLDFSCWVMDNRPELCDTRLFPDAKKVLHVDYEDIGRFVRINPADYVVVMTHGHAADYTVQRQVMRCETTYIGVIGSKNKVRALSEKLAAAGFSAEAIAAVHAPIGLVIKAETPEEIAISIAGELIRVRAEKRGK